MDQKGDFQLLLYTDNVIDFINEHNHTEGKDEHKEIKSKL